MKHDSGYTLVEMITVLALFSVVSAALLTLFVSATNSEVQSNRRFQAQQNARLALSKVRREVHCASTASVTQSGAHVTLTVPNSTCRGYPTVSWCAVGSGLRWALYRKAGATCDATGTKYVDYLTAGALFTYYTPTTTVSAKLKINLPVNTLPSEGESYTLEDELTLRNSSRL